MSPTVKISRHTSTSHHLIVIITLAECSILLGNISATNNDHIFLLCCDDDKYKNMVCDTIFLPRSNDGTLNKMRKQRTNLDASIFLRDEDADAEAKLVKNGLLEKRLVVAVADPPPAVPRLLLPLLWHITLRHTKNIFSLTIFPPLVVSLPGREIFKDNVCTHQIVWRLSSQFMDKSDEGRQPVGANEIVMR